MTYSRRSVASGFRRSPNASAGASAGAPPLDAFTNAPVAAYDLHQRVLSSYTGALHTVRKTTGGDTVTTHDVPYAAATNLLDTADRAAFVGAESWAVTAVKDQTTGARHLTQTTGSAQPVGGTSGTGVTGSSGRTSSSYASASSQRLARADALGLSGAIAMTLFAEVKADASIVTSRVPAGIGNNGTTGQEFSILFTNPTTVFVNIAGANRSFTCPDASAASRKVLIAIGAGAGVGTARCWVDGVELSELSSVNPANTMSLGTVGTSIGGRPTYASGTGWDGQVSRAYFWNADFGAAGNAADLARALAL